MRSMIICAASASSAALSTSPRSTWNSRQHSERLAHRVLELRLAEVNSLTYRPKHTITFGEFWEKWKQTVLPQHKPSSQSSERAHLNRLLPYFAAMPMSAISAEVVQKWISQQTCAPKTVRNHIATMRILWGSAKTWGYVSHDPFEGLRLPKRGLVSRPCFRPQQPRDIISAADELYKTMFWIVAETGIRGGELRGLSGSAWSCRLRNNIPGHALDQ